MKKNTIKKRKHIHKINSWFLSHIYPFIDGFSMKNMYNPSIFIDMFIYKPSVYC